MGKARYDERTLKMMEGFMADHNNGLSIAEIAKKYNISSKLIYVRLEEIAARNGVSRDALLAVIKTSTTFNGARERDVVFIDVEDFGKKATAVIENIDSLITETELILKD